MMSPPHLPLGDDVTTTFATLDDVTTTFETTDDIVGRATALCR